jgi:glutamate synthase (NADPH/NADH) small chain
LGGAEALMNTNGSKLPFKVLQTNFAEIHPPLTPDEALVEAARCLYCFDAPCTRACPTHIDIPRFIRQILHRDTTGAAKTILDANIFGGSCARVCPTEVLCEGACVDNTILKAPVQIGRLQRFACDAAHETSTGFYEPGPPTGKRVAIIGAGPAGLTCAHELRKRGHEVVVFEAGKVPGGLNTLGIAAYKISTEFALSEVERILRMGIDLRLNSPVDAKQLAKLLDEHDAVFLGIGLGKTAALGIPSEDLDGVWESLRFIFQTHTKPLNRCKVGKQVIVIGGGNTAIDAANAAKRLGAESVTVAYRRDRDSMPAFAHEYELAASAGVKFEWLASPVRITGRNGCATGARFIRNRIKGRGRRAKLVAIRGSEFSLPADMVIKALGQEPLLDLLKAVPGLRLDERGRIGVDPQTGATTVPKLFGGGDAQANAGEEVVNAVEAGKTAARGIHTLLNGASAKGAS